MCLCGEAIALHHELEICVKAGIPTNEVLKIATYNEAKNCRLENIYGEIKINRDADFILIDGNPLEKISDIRRVEWVIKNGKIYNPKQLLASQGLEVLLLKLSPLSIYFDKLT
ncbi:MAG: amidohydrolase family protein [Bacteroidota bacterium]|nr:amidohydrolase family protein [Bacteroidota bacterium]